MRVKIKKVFFTVLLWGCLAAVFGLGISSCSFFDEEDVDDKVVAYNAMQKNAIANGKQALVTISGTATAPADFMRTALPSMDVTKIILRNKGTGEEVSANVSNSQPYFTFTVTPGTYNFYANIYGSRSGPYGFMLADGTEGTDLIIGSGQTISGLTLKIVPKMSAGGSGSINLTVNRSSDSGITALSYSLTGSGGSGSQNFDASGKALISVSDIASGTYTLVLTFVAGTSPVYHAVEVVNVYDGLVTNTWQGSSEYIDGSTGAFTVTKAMVDNFSRTTFYVSGIGGTYASVASDANEGTYFKPFATLTKAVAVVSSSNLDPGTGGFRIFIDGNLTEYNIDFSPASSKTLAISSIGSADVTIDANNAGRVFKVGQNAKLTLVNLVMQNGKSAEKGGGIYVSPGADLTLTGCTVKSCQTTDTIGGGIVCKFGSGTSTTLSMTNTKITGNKIVYSGTTMTLSGAGIFIENQAGNYTIGQGCEIMNNIIDCKDAISQKIINSVGYSTGNKGTHTFASGVKIDGNYFTYSDSNKPTVLSTGIHQESGSSLSIGGVTISSVDDGKKSVLDDIGDSVYSSSGKFIRVNGCSITPERRAVLLNGAANALPGLGDGSVLYLGKLSDSTGSDLSFRGVINITCGSASDSYTIQRTNLDTVSTKYVRFDGGMSDKCPSFITMSNGSAGNWNFSGLYFWRNASSGKSAFRIEGKSAAAVTFNQCGFNMCYAYAGAKADEKMGGAIYMNAINGSVTLNKTAMSDCFATTSGGGVAVCAGTLTVGYDTSIDIKIKNSECTDRGIYVKSGATLNIGGSPYVNEIYLDDGASVNVNADLTTDKVMTIIPKSYAVGSQIVTGTNLATNVKKFAIDNINYTISSTGILQSIGPVEGLAKLTNNLKSGDNVTLTLDSNITKSITSSSPLTIDGINPSVTGIIYVPSGATLTLKGKTSERTIISISDDYSNTRVVAVESGGTLNLENIEFSGENKRMSIISVIGTVNLKNCKISGAHGRNSSSNGGSAITIRNGGKVRMDGGIITGCTRPENKDSGGIVSILDGTFIMKGGAEISNNTLKLDTHGVVYLSSGTFTMESGSGSSVKQKDTTGYAVYNISGTFNQNGCTVSGTIGP